MRTSNPSSHPTPVRSMSIELLAIDLSTCNRCTGTGANLDAAIARVATQLRDQGVAVNVTKTVVTSAAQAERLRFESSPTIRVDGKDIALELRESSCGDCGDLCGCDGGVDCRVWVWEGREHLEAPEPMIVEAILRAYREGPRATATSPAAPFRLPDNLRRFFEAKAQADAGAGATGRTGCCGSAAGSAGGK